MQNLFIQYINVKNPERVITRADPYNTINIVDDEMQAHVQCNK